MVVVDGFILIQLSSGSRDVLPAPPHHAAGPLRLQSRASDSLVYCGGELLDVGFNLEC